MTRVANPTEATPAPDLTVDVASLEAAFAAPAVEQTILPAGRSGFAMDVSDATAPMSPAVRFVAMLAVVLIVSVVVMVLLTMLGVQR